MAQRVEKVAQRRVEERNEKIKSERKTRFNLKSNPFFSRPPDSITKEFARLQQEQQEQIPPQRVLITTPTNFIDSIQLNNHQTSNILNSHSSSNMNIKSKQMTTKTNKLLDSTDDDESGTPTASIIETNQNNRSHLYHSPSPTIKRPIVKSATTRHIATTDTAIIGSIKKLKIIFPLNYKSKYRHLFLLDKIAYIYIQLVIMLGHKTMTGGQFRSFAKYISILFFFYLIFVLFLISICGIINETITAPSIDILYYQILRKWQQFVLRTNSTGRILKIRF
jgi:hypothetical protein